MDGCQNVLVEPENKSCRGVGCLACMGKNWPRVYLWVLVGVLGVLGILGGVYAGIKIGQKQVTPSSILISQPTGAVPTVAEPSPIPTQDPTADWKTYNSKYGFEFKYPGWNDWQVEEFPHGSDFLTGSVVNIYNYDFKNASGRSYSVKDGNLFKIDVGLDKTQSSVNQWFEKQKQLKDDEDNPFQFFNIKSIDVSSQKGIYFETKDRFSGLSLGTAVFETPGKGIIIFAGGLNFSANKNYFDQILSTFKFLP